MATFIVELDPQFHTFYAKVEADDPAEAERKALMNFEWDAYVTPFEMRVINVYPDEE